MTYQKHSLKKDYIMLHKILDFPDQPGLHIEILSQNEKRKKKVGVKRLKIFKTGRKSL